MEEILKNFKLWKHERQQRKFRNRLQQLNKIAVNKFDITVIGKSRYLSIAIDSEEKILIPVNNFKDVYSTISELRDNYVKTHCGAE